MIEVTPTCAECGDLAGGVYDEDDDYETTGLAAGAVAMHARTHPDHTVTLLTETVEDGEIWRMVESELDRAQTAAMVNAAREEIASRGERERLRTERLRRLRRRGGL